MKELRWTESVPEEVLNELMNVLRSLGFPPEQVSREGWAFNPKTGYLRFKVFLSGGEGGFLMDPWKLERVKVEKVRKVKPFWRKRLIHAMSEFLDGSRVKVPR